MSNLSMGQRWDRADLVGCLLGLGVGIVVGALAYALVMS